MLGVLPFVEDPDLSWSAAPALPQHLPPNIGISSNFRITKRREKFTQGELFVMVLVNKMRNNYFRMSKNGDLGLLKRMYTTTTSEGWQICATTTSELDWIWFAYHSTSCQSLYGAHSGSGGPIFSWTKYNSLLTKDYFVRILSGKISKNHCLVLGNLWWKPGGVKCIAGGPAGNVGLTLAAGSIRYWVGVFNFVTDRVRVLVRYFWSIGYYRVMKILIGYFLLHPYKIRHWKLEYLVE